MGFAEEEIRGGAKSKSKEEGLQIHDLTAPCRLFQSVT